MSGLRLPQWDTLSKFEFLVAVAMRCRSSDRKWSAFENGEEQSVESSAYKLIGFFVKEKQIIDKKKEEHRSWNRSLKDTAVGREGGKE